MATLGIFIFAGLFLAYRMGAKIDPLTHPPFWLQSIALSILLYLLIFLAKILHLYFLPDQ